MISCLEIKRMWYYCSNASHQGMMVSSQTPVKVFLISSCTPNASKSPFVSSFCFPAQLAHPDHYNHLILRPIITIITPPSKHPPIINSHAVRVLRAYSGIFAFTFMLNMPQTQSIIVKLRPRKPTNFKNVPIRRRPLILRISWPMM